jgi:hypothetical protein
LKPLPYDSEIQRILLSTSLFIAVDSKNKIPDYITDVTMSGTCRAVERIKMWRGLFALPHSFF